MKSISGHILPTSSNLLGICFIILSFIKVSHLADNTFLDEFIGVPIALFFSASIFSYLAIRCADKAPAKHEQYEKIADGVFIAGITSLSIVAFVFISKAVA